MPTNVTGLARRSGPRPETGPAIPHQQLSENAPAGLQEDLWARMSRLDAAITGPSGISLPDTRALHLEPGLALGPPEAFMVGTEFAHLHGRADGSLHLTLPPEARTMAIDLGWAEPHPLARSSAGLAAVVMLYGPRDQAELEAIWELVLVSYGFARGNPG